MTHSVLLTRASKGHTSRRKMDLESKGELQEGKVRKQIGKMEANLNNQ